MPVFKTYPGQKLMVAKLVGFKQYLLNIYQKLYPDLTFAWTDILNTPGVWYDLVVNGNNLLVAAKVGFNSERVLKVTVHSGLDPTESIDVYLYNLFKEFKNLEIRIIVERML